MINSSDKEHSIPIAKELAKKQREISVAEFFEKNKQILGFDSAPRSLITTVKEGVDNSLDACEEAGILPNLILYVEKASKDSLTVILEDNGPGIVKEQIPKVFAKLLYGSRFHTIKQSRGQQGIGISASVLYAQLTTGKPTKIISKIGLTEPAHLYEIMINTRTNDPEILKEEIIDWDRVHGTRIELEIEASYVKGRRQSIYEYLKATAIVNPHARITFVEPDGNEIIFERATDVLPKLAKEILPHPTGIELGTLMKMMRYTDRQKLGAFLRYSFSKIGLLAAEEICKASGIDFDADPKELNREQIKKVLDAFKKVKIMAPPTDCLSPIGENLIYKGLEKEYNMDFISTVTRPPSVFSGNPFIVEVGLAYGGHHNKENRIEILRFANRVPLLYQQGGCAITHVIESINWKQYGLNQPGGGGVPTGPMMLLIHVASTNIPFTSESKDAIADIPEIKNEIELAIKEVARKLNLYLNRQILLKKRREKEIIIEKVLPKMLLKLSEILETKVPDINPVVARIMGNVLIKREIVNKSNGVDILIKIENFGDKIYKFKLHDMIPYNIKNTIVDPTIIKIGDEFDYVWDIELNINEKQAITYSIDFISENEIAGFPDIIIEGVEEEVITGAKAIIQSVVDSR